jgi:hypothetical protein
MHSLPEIFAVWRLQAETVEGILHDRKFKRQAKQLKSILKLLDEMWMHEHGEPYVQELVRLIELMTGDETPAADTAACDDASGAALPFVKKGAAP